jgi:hypothetical protein
VDGVPPDPGEPAGDPEEPPPEVEPEDDAPRPVAQEPAESNR